MEDLKEVDHNVKELQLQLDKKLQLQLHRKLSFQKISAKYELKNYDINSDELCGITISNTQSPFKELNDGKIPDELKFFLGGNEGTNALKFHTIKKVGSLDESNENFLDYLLSDFGHEVL